jgi:hypothetical protein
MLPRHTPSLCLLWSALLLASGCVSARQAGPDADARPRDGVFTERGATVLTGTALTDGHGSLLDTMRGKIPSFRVHRGTGQCPGIALRGSVTVAGVTSPDVYVDGARATDTCILESLRATDIDRVEVYPMGFTTRPGYRTHSEGLILVFLRSIQP